jgi:hypothetical protein
MAALVVPGLLIIGVSKEFAAVLGAEVAGIARVTSTVKLTESVIRRWITLIDVQIR